MSKEYLISEEELKTIVYPYALETKEEDLKKYIKNTLNSKKPVEFVAEGEVIFKKFGDEEKCYIGEGTDISFWILENWTGQKVKIILEILEEE